MNRAEMWGGIVAAFLLMLVSFRSSRTSEVFFWATVVFMGVAVLRDELSFNGTVASIGRFPV